MIDDRADPNQPSSEVRPEVELGARLRGLEAFARQASLLQAVSTALARAVTVQEIADVVTTHGKALFGAAATLLYLLDEAGGTLELQSWGGVRPGRIETYRRLPLDAAMPLPRAVRTGEPVWLGTRAALLADCPQLAGIELDGAPLQATVCLPLKDVRATIGGLAFSFYRPIALDAVQRDLFLSLGAQCCLAVERARAFAAERRAHEAEKRANELLQRQQQRLAVLARAAERLSSSLDSRRALGELAKMVVPSLADWCVIDELGPDRQIRHLAIEHRDPAKIELAARLAERYPTSPDAPRGVSAVLRTGETEWMPEIPDALLVAGARDEEHLALGRSLGLTSYAVVPIKARGRVLGALTLVSEGSRRLLEDDLRFAEELARRAALALDNARLYERAEAARAHLHGLFMQAPAAISICRGPELRFELANEPYRRLVGRDELVGRPLREALSGPDSRDMVERAARVYATGEPFVASELPVRIDVSDRPGGGERHFNVVCQATRDGAGAVDGVATFAFEVTDQVVARRQLEALAADVARSEARLSALVEATAAIVWTARPDGVVVETSPSWLAFTGQSEAEYRDGGFLDAIHPDDRAATMAIWTAAVGAGKPYAAEYRLRRRDGGYAHTLARGMPVRAADGAVLEYVGCNVDVTDLRRAEALAREHAEALSTLNRLGRAIAAELDLEEVAQAVTEAATTLSGAQFGAFFYNAHEGAGRYMLYASAGGPREGFSLPMPRTNEVFAPTFAGQGVVRSDDITRDPRYGRNAPYFGTPAGHLPVRSYLAVPVVSRSSAVLGGLLLGHPDVGVFDERAEALVSGLAAQAAVAMDNARLFGDAQRLIRALEATNRELDQFAYVTSHDLKAPLRGINSLAEWIEEDLGADLTDATRRKLDLLRGRVRRMEALIHGILEFSRAGRLRGDREDVDVGKLLADIVELLAPRPPAAVTVAEGMPTLHTERVALQQVFLNLIGNALKHAGRADVLVRVDARDVGDAWEFRVADNGPGIAPEYHERVWGIFQTLQARDKLESTGIGLAIVKKIVDGRQGRVWIDATEGGGATFCFTWPKREKA